MRMLGKLKKTCRANMRGSQVCDCGNAHDSKGKTLEKRLVKRQEKQKLRNELRKY